MAPGTRTLHLSKLDPTSGAVKDEATVVQQADASSAFDVAWPETGGGAPLVAWDEDAPIAVGEFLPDRGRVRIQLVGPEAPVLDGGPRSVVASPYATDADSPRVLSRARGGFFLAWIAQRPESTEDAGIVPEGPGEHRMFRWVEIVEVSASGEIASPIKRVSSSNGHVVAFDLVRGGGSAEVVVVVQDEAAHAEHAGARIVRYGLSGERWEPSDLVDAGVGHALSEIVSVHADAGVVPRWLSWSDGAEHAHLVPLGASMSPGGAATLEPALDGARLLAGGASGDVAYALAGSTIKRFSCR
jgi:hypothetical protein